MVLGALIYYLLVVLSICVLSYISLQLCLILKLGTATNNKILIDIQMFLLVSLDQNGFKFGDHVHITVLIS